MYTRMNNNNNYLCGVYKNVPAFANFPRLDKHPERILTGEKWQCIEYVRRFFLHHYGVLMPEVQNAYDLLACPKWLIMANRSVFRPAMIENVEDALPDDIVVFQDGKHGHVGIVTHIKNRRLFIADQNYEYGCYWRAPHYAHSTTINDPSILAILRVGNS